MYVTGSTGTGKSTQIPKLTLYILKMYDYKIDGIVICTQPRIAPTEENAKRIASEMGVELQYTKDGEKYNTSNYYIQYKHMKGEHMKQNSSHLEFDNNQKIREFLRSIKLFFLNKSRK